MSLRHILKRFLRPDYRKDYEAWQILRNTPRYTFVTTNVLGAPLEVVDSASFIAMYKEIYTEQVYRFNSDKSDPYIIDCGANIGVSVLYFKQQFPGCKIVAFEADTVVYETLLKNLNSFGVRDVETINKAVWNADTQLQFAGFGADAGRVATPGDTAETKLVEAVRLRPYLHKPVDLLKIDIEGAETVVLEDCVDLLSNVENLFVEYHSFTGQEQTLNIVLDVLKQAGFRVYIRVVSDTSSSPFHKLNSYIGMDLQLNIFGYRSEHE